MKKKIAKSLENHKIIIPIAILIAIVLGFLIFKYVGRPPQNNLNLEDNIYSSDSTSNNLKDGQNINLAFNKNGGVNNVYVKVGDKVAKGQILADLNSTDDQRILDKAKSNYQKSLNGKTGTSLDVAQTGVNTAETSLEATKIQQDLAVATAYNNLLNSSLEAVPSDTSNLNSSSFNAPIISGNYTLGKEGAIVLHIYSSTGGISFSSSGVVYSENIMVSSSLSQPIGNSGLFIKLPANFNSTDMNMDWIINLPNKKAPNYLPNYNMYQSALEARTRFLNLAQASLDQAKSNLALIQANTKPEDISITKTQLDVAMASYENNFIHAPTDGLITSVDIKSGESVAPDQKVIGMIVKLTK